MSTLNFPLELRRAMKHEGLSVHQLEKESGVTAAYIYRILDDAQNPSLRIASKLASALGLELRLVGR